MRTKQRYIVMFVAITLICGCETAPPIHLGSVNESGIPNQTLQTLEEVRRHGSDNVRTRQAIQGLKISVDDDKGLLTLQNHSGLYFDQLSFTCEVGRSQFAFFTWLTGVVTDPGGRPFEDSKDTNTPLIGKFDTYSTAWLKPNTSHQIFSTYGEQLSLLHNQPTNEEGLTPIHLRWLVNNFHPHDCSVLDIADATEDNPLPAPSTR